MAENIATLFGAYHYPDQAADWKLVHPEKIGSRFILSIMRFVMVAKLEMVKCIAA